MRRSTSGQGSRSATRRPAACTGPAPPSATAAAQGGDQAVAQLPLVRTQVSTIRSGHADRPAGCTRRPAVALGGAAEPGGLAAGMHGRVALGVDHGHLPVLEALLGAVERPQDGLRPVAAGSSFRAAGPRRGSAMLWTTTAPTWAWTKAQRPVTARARETTPTPSWPVAAHRARMAQVIGCGNLEALAEPERSRRSPRGRCARRRRRRPGRAGSAVGVADDLPGCP